ncbi:MAG: hypothetical protein GC201_03020 [Alphaproteobacteria bacterium]|nr:hypothetical protein [Alphaproteobacteria bacterium]
MRRAIRIPRHFILAVLLGASALGAGAVAQPLTRSTAIAAPDTVRLLQEHVARTPGVTVDLKNAATPAETRLPAAPAESAAPAKPLRPGIARFVRLGTREEQQSQALVKDLLPAAVRPGAAVFDGVVQTVGKDDQTLTLKAVAFPRAPLRRNPQTGLYEGAVSVGVIDVAGKGAHALSAPIAFQVLGPVTAQPDPASAAQTAPPYTDIRVSADTPDADLDVTVVSNVAPAGETLHLRVRPSLAMEVSPGNIQGWGLETANVLVRAQAFPANGTGTVQLSSTLGRLSENQAALGPGGMAQVSVRSESVGSGTISADGPGLDGASATIDYAFPWRFLGAALLGGLAGGLLRKRSRARGLPAFVRSLGIAVLSAAVVVGLYVLGVNLVGFALPSHGGEVLVFVVAALGALYGTRLLTAAPPAIP